VFIGYEILNFGPIRPAGHIIFHVKVATKLAVFKKYLVLGYWIHNQAEYELIISHVRLYSHKETF